MIDALGEGKPEADARLRFRRLAWMEGTIVFRDDGQLLVIPTIGFPTICDPEGKESFHVLDGNQDEFQGRLPGPAVTAQAFPRTAESTIAPMACSCKGAE